MTTDPYRDQVEKLRKRIDKISTQEKPDILGDEKESSLPSRLELHRKRSKKTKKKKRNLKFLLIRILLIFFILLPVGSFYIYTVLFDKTPFSPHKEKASGEEIAFETEGSSKEYQLEKEDIPKENKEINQQQNKEEQKNTNQEKNVEKKDPPLKSTEKNIENKEKTSKITEIENKEESSETTANGNTANQDGKIIYHTVQPKETLFSIAMKYYHSQAGIEKIKQWNTITNNEIMVGQVLQIHLP